MTTFDDLVPAIKETLAAHADELKRFSFLLINRDLYGRVRLIAPETVQEEDVARAALERLAIAVTERLGPHAYPPKSAILYEADRELACQGAATVLLEGHANVWLVDRLATEGNWAQITPETKGPPRIVFFSIKGGVGRSTALAATAWCLAQAGKRVLVLDLNFESPGLSSNLLSLSRHPKYGITDWLVEDLVDNADAVFENLIATSDLSRDFDIYVVPAHGADPGEYVAKLGRAWMPKIQPGGTRESWSSRLRRLLQALEQRVRPDVVLIDSSAGIGESASACVTDLGANLVLLFSLEDLQTWIGCRILFEHWQRAGEAESMSERLRLVAAATHDSPVSDQWHFEAADDIGLRAPWKVRWHQSFARSRSLHEIFSELDATAVCDVFGTVIDGIVQISEQDLVRRAQYYGLKWQLRENGGKHERHHDRQAV